MSEILQRFVDTLPEDIQALVNGKKNKKVLAILKENGIVVPQEILDEIEQRTADANSYDNILASMWECRNNKVEDVDCIIKL